MRLVLACVPLAAAVTSCALPTPTPEPPRTRPAALPSSLDADWLDGTSELTPERFERALAVVSRVPEGKELVDRAVARLGHGDRDALRARFSVCAPSDAPGLGGKTFLAGETQFVTRGDDYAEQLAARTHGPDLLDARVAEGPYYATIERWLVPRVCVHAGLPLRGAAEAFAHELEHAVFRDPRVVPMDPATAPDEITYAVAYVQVPGDEVDAYSVASRVRIAIDGNRSGIAYPLLHVLDRTGNPTVPREDLARIIVDPPPGGLGYGQGVLEGALANAKDAEARLLAGKRALLVAYAASREALAKELARRSLRDRLDAAKAAESRARAEIPVIDARLRALGSPRE